MHFDADPRLDLRSPSANDDKTVIRPGRRIGTDHNSGLLRASCFGVFTMAAIAARANVHYARPTPYFHTYVPMIIGFMSGLTVASFLIRRAGRPALAQRPGRR